MTETKPTKPDKSQSPQSCTQALCLALFVFQRELTVILHLLHTDNTNNSLTSLPPDKLFMSTVIISQQQQCLKASQQPTGIVVKSIYTSVSVH